MNRLLFQGKYTIWGAIITTLVLASLWQFSQPVFNTGFFVIYLFFFGYHLGRFILPKEKTIWQTFFGTIALAGLLAVILSAVYWFYQINAPVISIVLVLVPFLISFLPHKQDDDIFANIETTIDLESYAYIKSHLAVKLWFVIAMLGEILLFFILLGKRYSDTLISPWTIIGPRFFLVFFFLTALIIWILQKSKHSASNTILLGLHGCLTLSVSLLIFKYGFGFDPIIHQATEKWIVDHGFILPKQPYYLGQYMLVIMGHLITKIKIHLLDSSLVPILAGIILPFSAYFSFSRINFKYKIAPAILLIFFIPLNFFTATTPNNLALLFAVLLAFWLWYESHHGTITTNLFGIIIAIFTITIHPFVGLPTTVIYLGSLALNKLKSKNNLIFYSLYSLILTLTIPLTFYLNSLRLSTTLKIINPLQNLANFWEIFAKPHWIWLNHGNWAWQALYYYREAIRPIAIIIIIIGIIIMLKKYHQPLAKFFIYTTLSLVVSAFILATTINFAEVISYEQKVYAMRLLELALVLLFPYFIITWREFFIRLRRQPIKQFLISFFLAILLLISWYFTYPTRDPVSFYTGYNIRQSDIDTVHMIANLNPQTKYIVLTNQVVGVTALKEFGFGHYLDTPAGEQYFYSIPTGGPLYQYFRKMVYEEPKYEWMAEAMRFAGVQKAYFVHTNYWAPAGEIRDQAKLEADNWWELYGGRVWVYEYLLK